MHVLPIAYTPESQQQTCVITVMSPADLTTKSSDVSHWRPRKLTAPMPKCLPSQCTPYAGTASQLAQRMQPPTRACSHGTTFAVRLNKTASHGWPCSCRTGYMCCHEELDPPKTLPCTWDGLVHSAADSPRLHSARQPRDRPGACVCNKSGRPRGRRLCEETTGTTLGGGLSFCSSLQDASARYTVSHELGSGRLPYHQRPAALRPSISHRCPKHATAASREHGPCVSAACAPRAAASGCVGQHCPPL